MISADTGAPWAPELGWLSSEPDSVAVPAQMVPGDRNMGAE